jgi:hypothetical protein
MVVNEILLLLLCSFCIHSAAVFAASCRVLGRACDVCNLVSFCRITTIGHLPRHRGKEPKCILILALHSGPWTGAFKELLLLSRANFLADADADEGLHNKVANTDRQPHCQGMKGTDNTFKVDEVGWRKEMINHTYAIC